MGFGGLEGPTAHSVPMDGHVLGEGDPALHLRALQQIEGESRRSLVGLPTELVGRGVPRPPWRLRKAAAETWASLEPEAGLSTHWKGTPRGGPGGGCRGWREEEDRWQADPGSARFSEPKEMQFRPKKGGSRTRIFKVVKFKT